MAEPAASIHSTASRFAPLPLKPVKTPHPFVEILGHPWKHREHTTGAMGVACLVVGAISILTGVWIGKVAIVALIGLTLLVYAQTRKAVVDQQEMERARKHALEACKGFKASIPEGPLGSIDAIEQALPAIIQKYRESKSTLFKAKPLSIPYIESYMASMDDSLKDKIRAAKADQVLEIELKNSFQAFCKEVRDRIDILSKELSSQN